MSKKKKTLWEAWGVWLIQYQVVLYRRERLEMGLARNRGGLGGLRLGVG